MTFSLEFNDCSVRSMEQLTEIDLKIQKEDIDKGLEIGLITPRELSESDYKDFPELCQEINFLMLQEQDDEEMFDDLEEMINQDVQQTDYPYFEDVYDMFEKPDPLRGEGIEVIIRVVMNKGRFYLGSIAGQPVDVYIPSDISGWNVDIHSYYLMDIKWTPEQRNKWTVTKIHAKLDSSDMLIAESKHTQYGEVVQQHYTFDLPTPSYYIGAMIGKEGRNINNLIETISSWIPEQSGSDYEPEFTFTPYKDYTRVDVYIPHGCMWKFQNICNTVSHFHY